MQLTMQRSFHGGGVVGQALRRVGDDIGDAVIGGDGILGHRSRQRHRQLRGYWGDQPNPCPGEMVGWQGQRYVPDITLQTPSLRVELEEVGKLVDHAAADVETVVHRLIQVGDGNKVVQDVADGYWLDFVVDPLRRDHDGEPFGEVANHLERRRPGADQRRSAQYHRWSIGLQQRSRDLFAGTHVLGQFPH